MPKIPDRINIDRKDKELYNEGLDPINWLKFRERGGKRTRKEQFLFAMAVGFKNRVRRPLETKEGFFLIKDLQPEDEALLNALAMFEKGVEILSNKEEVFKIAEEYAHAGIKILVDEIKSSPFGSVDKKFEKELFDLFERIEQGSEYSDKDTSG